MSATLHDAPPATQSERDFKRLERAVRLCSGLVLLAFVTSHFLNHALGIFGTEVMGQAQEWRVAVWRSWPGTIVLVGALILHVGLSLWRVVSRRTWRMPWMEALQIVLGVAIPFLLLGHVVGTRVLSSAAGIDDSYPNILRYLWPGNALTQSFALLVVWGHGMIGLYYAFHTRRWFRERLVALAILASLVPALALAGFVSAGREAVRTPAPPEVWTASQLATQVSAMMTGRMVLLAILLGVVAIIAYRFVRARMGSRVTLRYLGHGEVTAARGLTVLEISRSNRIPHPSTCGGRGRCSSCRVLITDGLDSLPSPSVLEQKMLDRIRAPQNVRLACQTRPTGDIGVKVLLGAHRLPVVASESGTLADWGGEEELAVLFADIRGFATLAENQLPTDLLTVLDRTMSELIQAVEARGGLVTMVQTDGLMAVFGMGGNARAGNRGALNAAADMLKAMQLLNKDMRASLPLPLRIGIGIHSGKVILSRSENAAGGQRYIVIGQAVVIASRLEEMTKELAADCVVSSRTINAAGLIPPQGERTIHYKNGSRPVLAHAFPDRQSLRLLLGRTGTRDTARAEAPAPAAAPAATPMAST